MNKPRVSIIVPIYNSERYLEKCILSLINQTLKEIEIILVNDASPDNSMEIVNRYAQKDSRIVVIDNKVNVVASRNFGIKKARANYLGFVDADDWVEEDTYEKLYNATNNESIDVVAADVRCQYSSGDTMVQTNIELKAFESPSLVKSYVSQYGGRLLANIWRRSLVTDDMLFREYCLYDDSIVITWYLKAKSFAKVNEPLYQYFINDQSITHYKNDDRYFDRCIGAKDMFERSQIIGLYGLYKEEIDYAFYRLFYRNTINGLYDAFSYIPFKNVVEIRKTFLSLVDIESNKYFLIHKFEKINYLARIMNYNAYLGLGALIIEWSFLALLPLIPSNIKNIIKKILKR